MGGQGGGKENQLDIVAEYDKLGSNMEDFKIILKQITAKNSEELTEADIVFMKARASYLSEDEKAKFALALGREAKEAEEPQTEEAKPKRAGRRSRRQKVEPAINA